MSREELEALRKRKRLAELEARAGGQPAQPSLEERYKRPEVQTTPGILGMSVPQAVAGETRPESYVSPRVAAMMGGAAGGATAGYYSPLQEEQAAYPGAAMIGGAVGTGATMAAAPAKFAAFMKESPVIASALMGAAWDPGETASLEEEAKQRALGGLLGLGTAGLVKGVGKGVELGGKGLDKLGEIFSGFSPESKAAYLKPETRAQMQHYAKKLGAGKGRSVVKEVSRKAQRSLKKAKQQSKFDQAEISDKLAHTKTRFDAGRLQEVPEADELLKVTRRQGKGLMGEPVEKTVSPETRRTLRAKVLRPGEAAKDRKAGLVVGGVKKGQAREPGLVVGGQKEGHFLPHPGAGPMAFKYGRDPRKVMQATPGKPDQPFQRVVKRAEPGRPGVPAEKQVRTTGRYEQRQPLGTEAEFDSNELNKVRKTADKLADWLESQGAEAASPAHASKFNTQAAEYRRLANDIRGQVQAQHPDVVDAFAREHQRYTLMKPIEKGIGKKPYSYLAGENPDEEAFRKSLAMLGAEGLDTLSAVMSGVKAMNPTTRGVLGVKGGIVRPAGRGLLRAAQPVQSVGAGIQQGALPLSVLMQNLRDK